MNSNYRAVSCSSILQVEFGLFGAYFLSILLGKIPTWPNKKILFKPSTGKLKDDLERWGQMNDN